MTKTDTTKTDTTTTTTNPATKKKPGAAGTTPAPAKK